MHCLHEYIYFPGKKKKKNEYIYFFAMWIIWDLPFAFLHNIRKVTTWDLSHSTEGESWPDQTQKKERGDS